MIGRYVKSVWGAMYEWPSDKERSREITDYLNDALAIPDDTTLTLARVRAIVNGTRGFRGKADNTVLTILRAGFRNDEYILSRLTDLRPLLAKAGYSEGGLRNMLGLTVLDAPEFFRKMRATYPNGWTKPGNRNVWKAAMIPMLITEADQYE